MLQPQENRVDNGIENTAYVGDEPTTSSTTADGASPADKSVRKSQFEMGTGEVQPERMQWDSQWEFLMSCISMSVGLGNVWRFPVTAFNNGGGAFLFPYFVVLIFIGRPMYFLELCLGQFTSYSQVKVWKCVPAFKGVGYGSMIATMAVLTYYVSIMSLTIFYFLMSFQATLPWSECNEAWADKDTCNGTGLAAGVNRTIPEMYYLNEVIREYANIENGIGNPDWRLSICLVFSWAFIFFALIKGVKSSGKVAYFTAIFPYVVLIILLVRGITLEGASEGIRYFLKPDWKKILEPGVWYAAVTQCFFSLNAGVGSIIMFASYNPFNHNIYRDAVVVSLLDTFTSMLAGFTIFAVLGNLAHELNVPVNEVVKAGNDLVFVSYPDAIAKFQFVPQFFGLLFFFMLFILGIGSSMADAGTIVTIFCDKFPNISRLKVTTVVCVVGCSVGVIYITPGGQFLLNLVDYFGGALVIFTATLLEVIGIAWIYGTYNFIADIEFMLNMRIGWYWKICWGFIIPVGLLVILVYTLATEANVTYKNLPYPPFVLAIGWMIFVLALVAFIISMLHSAVQTEGDTFIQRFKGSFKPKNSWGPRDPQTKEEWKAYKASLKENSFVCDLKRWKRNLGLLKK